MPFVQIYLGQDNHFCLEDRNQDKSMNRLKLKQGSCQDPFRVRLQRGRVVRRAGLLPAPCGADLGFLNLFSASFFNLLMENTVFIHTYKGAPTSGDIFIGKKVANENNTNNFSLRVSGLFGKMAKTTAIVGVVLLLISFAPSIWHVTKTQGTAFVSKIFAKTKTEDVTTLTNEASNIGYQPRFDASLPLENTIRIPSIGVNTGIQESTLEYYEEALKKGVWRVSDFGTPATANKSMIVAAHRFGYLTWSNVFRRENSFFNLPKLKEGEIVEVVWRQRKYVYEIYKTSKGEEISDYSADLILYTCEALSSPVRIYKYARLLKV